MSDVSIALLGSGFVAEFYMQGLANVPAHKVVANSSQGYAETEVFAPCVVKARQMIEQGGVGRVLWVRSRESHSGPHSPHFWDIEKTGGGAMNDLGCHCIAAARYFFGKEDRIVEVMAW